MVYQIDFSNHYKYGYPHVVVPLDDDNWAVLFVPTNEIVGAYMNRPHALRCCMSFNWLYWQAKASHYLARDAILQGQQTSDPSYVAPASWPWRLGRLLSRLLPRR